MKLYTADEMSRADEGAQALGIPGGVLMERASVGMAAEILGRFPPHSVRAHRALVVSGGGNNGGDGFVVARELHRAGLDVAVVATKEDYSGDPATNLAYLSSMRIDPSVIEYYLSFLSIDPTSARRRLKLFSADDAGEPALCEKLHAQDALSRLSEVLGPVEGHLLPFNVTPCEASLARSLGLELLGAAPRLAYLGSKSGARRVARAAGVHVTDGVEDLRSMHEVEEAVAKEKLVLWREAARNILPRAAKSSRLIHHSGMAGSWKKNMYQLRSSCLTVRLRAQMAGGGTCSAASFQT